MQSVLWGTSLDNIKPDLPFVQFFTRFLHPQRALFHADCVYIFYIHSVSNRQCNLCSLLLFFKYSQSTFSTYFQTLPIEFNNKRS